MTLARLFNKIESYYPNFDRDLVERAYLFAEKAHAGQFRISGDPFIQHSLEVAYILADLQLDMLSIVFVSAIVVIISVARFGRSKAFTSISTW
jgi:guanosine-3',5'-bis(diphosphate) 3'-pyrophosphohydrolase